MSHLWFYATVLKHFHSYVSSIPSPIILWADPQFCNPKIKASRLSLPLSLQLALHIVRAYLGALYNSKAYPGSRGFRIKPPIPFMKNQYLFKTKSNYWYQKIPWFEKLIPKKHPGYVPSKATKMNYVKSSAQ